ncbi:hypothetical protein B0H14DRAFT_1272327 [Mycena olivaceomarginata]|nr:hypothetical protein B0H14DRAFT_1272327 [Mycena olivaceomarginata]
MSWRPSYIFSSVLEAGCRFNIAVYELHSWRSHKKLIEQEFSFDTLREVSSSPSNSKVYELSSKGGVVISVKLGDQCEGGANRPQLDASESGAKESAPKIRFCLTSRPPLKSCSRSGRSWNRCLSSSPLEPFFRRSSTCTRKSKKIEENGMHWSRKLPPSPATFFKQSCV